MSMAWLRTAILLSALLLAGAGCRRPETAKEVSSSHGPQTFSGTGIVTQLDEIQGRIGIRHEPIPGLMPAGETVFAVKDANLFTRIQINDQIRFRIKLYSGGMWISAIQILHSNGAAEITGSDSGQLPVGTLVPSIRLVDGKDHEFALSDLKGKIVFITFAYTRSPVASVGSHLLQKMAQIQHLLRPEEKERFRLLTISFDPAYDHGAVLQQAAEGYHADPAIWIWATGRAEELEPFCRSLHVVYWGQSGAFSHTTTSSIIDGEGRLRQLFRGNEWLPGDVIAGMRQAEAAWAPEIPVSK